MPATIQNRTMTVVSAQPASSKWWWIGAIRNTRCRSALNNATWMTTDSVTDHEQPAEHDQQQLGAGDDRQPGQQPAERQRAGVAHEDPGRRGVPPQEAEAGAHRRGRDQRECPAGRGRCSSRSIELGLAVVAELAERDRRYAPNTIAEAPARQPVQPVGEVHRVGVPAMNR